MVKRGPKVDPDSILKRRLIQEVFKNFSMGLSVRDTIAEAKKRGILSSPNKVLKLIRELYREGALDVRTVKAGKGPARKVYSLSLLAKMHQIPTDLEATFNMRKRVLSLGIGPLVEELQHSPAKYWTMRVLEAAEKAGVIKELKDNRDKVDFFKKLERNIGKRGAGASIALLRLTDISFALILSIITYAFLEETALQHGLVQKRRYDVIRGVETACDDISDSWADLVKRGITNFLFGPQPKEKNSTRNS